VNKKQNKDFYLPTNELPLAQRNTGARSHFMTDIFGSPINWHNSTSQSQTRSVPADK